MIETISYILSAIILAIIIFVVYEFNTFTRLKNKIKQSKSTIEVYLNKRFDLIPNLVECVKEYAEYEERILSNITKLRTDYENASEKDLKKGARLSDECNRLIAIGENNPNLKASDQFLELQRSLSKMESELQAARRVYNGDVTLYNTTISTFPGNLIAATFGFEQAELFEIEEFKKANIKVDL